jgi:hypothetical protein
MSSKTHWSRKPDEIRRATEFLRMAGLAFKDTAGTFSTLKPVPPKPAKTTQIVACQLSIFEKEVIK